VAKLVYSAIASLDGYVEDKHGDFASMAPDNEVHAFVNELERPVGTYLYGRRMYETMVYWESVATHGQHGPARDFADIWRGADKIVYSRTLTEPMSKRTTIERDVDPAAVNHLKDSLSSDISVGGAHLGGQVMAAGLVDECHLFLVPIVIGGGKPALPADVRVGLELSAERRFKSGIVHLHYGLVRHASWTLSSGSADACHERESIAIHGAGHPSGHKDGMPRRNIQLVDPYVTRCAQDDLRADITDCGRCAHRKAGETKIRNGNLEPPRVFVPPRIWQLGEVGDAQQFLDVDVFGREAAAQDVVTVGHHFDGGPLQVGVNNPRVQVDALARLQMEVVEQQCEQHADVTRVLIGS